MYTHKYTYTHLGIQSWLWLAAYRCHDLVTYEYTYTHMDIHIKRTVLQTPSIARDRGRGRSSGSDSVSVRPSICVNAQHGGMRASR